MRAVRRPASWVGHLPIPAREPLGELPPYHVFWLIVTLLLWARACGVMAGFLSATAACGQPPSLEVYPTLPRCPFPALRPSPPLLFPAGMLSMPMTSSSDSLMTPSSYSLMTSSSDSLLTSSPELPSFRHALHAHGAHGRAGPLLHRRLLLPRPGRSIAPSSAPLPLSL